MRATREARPQRGHRLGARQLSWMIWISKEAEDHHRYGLALLKQKVRGERCMPERRAPAMRPQTPRKSAANRTADLQEAGRFSRELLLVRI
jgi:hypothetical protein